MALQTALTASEARSEGGFVQEIPKTAGEKIRRLWHNIDASVADTLITSAEAVGTSGIITNPQVDGQTLSGSYAVGTVSYSDPDADRAVVITQELTLVATIAELANLSSRTPLITRSNTILRRYALAEGEEDAYNYVYPYLNPTSKTYVMDTLTDTQVAGLAGLGADEYITRQWQEQEDGTAVFSFTAKTAVWTAWDGNPAANITTYSQCGDNNEREVITKEWLGISKADLTTAVTELRAGTGHVIPSTDYVIMSVGANDNRDGSITLVQVQIKQLDGVTTSATRDEKWLINPHSYEGMLGVMTQQTIIYENFTKADIENTSIADPNNYVPRTDAFIISNIPKVMGNGLWQRIIITQSTDWANALSTANVVTNGTFDSNLSGWTDGGSNWSQSSGTALHTAGAVDTLSQDVSAVADTYYLVKFDVVGVTAGSVTMSVGGVADSARSTNGTFYVSILATGSGNLIFTPTSDFDGALDNVSVQTVDPSTSSSIKMVRTGETNVWDKDWTQRQTEVGADCFGWGETDFSRGIPLDEADSLVRASEPDTGYTLRSITSYESGKGEATVIRRQMPTYTHTSGSNNTKPYELRISSDSGKQAQLRRFVWYRVAHDSIDTVWSRSQVAGTSGISVLTNYEHKSSWIQPHPDGSADVYCEWWQPEGGTDIDPWEQKDKYWWTSFDQDGSIFEVQVLHTSSQAEAQAWVEGKSTDGWALNQHVSEDQAYWNETLTLPADPNNPSGNDAVVVGGVSGWVTQMRRISTSKYYAVRVIKRYTDATG